MGSAEQELPERKWGVAWVGSAVHGERAGVRAGVLLRGGGGVERGRLVFRVSSLLVLGISLYLMWERYRSRRRCIVLRTIDFGILE